MKIKIISIIKIKKIVINCIQMKQMKLLNKKKRNKNEIIYLINNEKMENPYKKKIKNNE